MTETYVYILSGGVNPQSNHYSQYLQAQRLNEYRLAQGLPGVIQFGAGYEPNTPDDQLHDVSQVVLVEGERQTRYIQGEIPDNRPATFAEVQTVFGELQAMNWQAGDRFVLFVGDHGSPNLYDLSCYDFSSNDEGKVTRSNNFSDSMINLWGPGINLFPEEASLDVPALDGNLSESIPSPVPVVAIMTQCYSGGFHRMAYHFDADGLPVRDADQNLVVFTAIHRKTTAAGCTPFVENDRYDGYERRIVEAITGFNVITGERIAEAEPAILAAHLSASLVDRTKDTPLRTSEAFVLDYYEALSAGGETLDATLDGLWKNAQKPDFASPFKSEALKHDYGRRLQYIQDLERQVKLWFPALKHEKLTKDLSSIHNAMAVAEALQSQVDAKLEKLKAEVKVALGPLQAEYLEAVKVGKLGTDVKKYETLLLLFNNESERLMETDPTLQALSDYENYTNYRNEHILAWASQNPKYAEQVETSRVLLAQQEMLETQSSEFEIQYACLQRIEQQMLVASMQLQFAANSDKRSKQALQDVESFVLAEEAAHI